MSKIYLKYFITKFVEFFFIGFVVSLYIYVFSIFFNIPPILIFICYLPLLLYLLYAAYTLLNKDLFAKYIERYNNLEEYFISFVELRNKKHAFAPLVEKKLKSILKKRGVRIPFNILILKTGLFAILLLLIFVIAFTHYRSFNTSWVIFNKVEYNAFPEQVVTFELKGKNIPDTVYIYGKDTFWAYVRSGSGYFVSPKDTGFYVLTCSTCMPSRLRIIKRPRIDAVGYVKGPAGWRRIERVDYLLSNSKIKLDITLKNADSAALSLCDKNVHLHKNRSFLFKLRANCKIGATLYADNIKQDTLLYNLYIVKDLPPRVIVLYPDKHIIPVMSDTVFVVLYIYDDIGLDKAYAFVQRGDYKKLIYEKKYRYGMVYDTLRLAIGDVLAGYDEARLKIVAIDVSGKEGYAALTYKKPSYEDRLNEFMSIKDSILSGESGGGEDDELKRYDSELKEREDLNLEEREKVKKSLEETYKKLEKTQRQLENVQKVMENLEDIVQDKNLMNAIEEFNRTFSEVLKKHFRDILKELSEKNAKIDTMDREELKTYIENINRRKGEIERELKKLKEFLKLAKEELDKEEFVSRFKHLSEEEKYLKDKTQYFDNIRPLEKTQQDIAKRLRSLKKLSPKLYERYEKDFKEIESKMKDISENLRSGKRKVSLRKEEELLKRMNKMASHLRSQLNKEMAQRKNASLKRINRLKWDLYFINFAAKPLMDAHERGLYTTSLKFILSYVDSFDAITYVSIFKVIGLLRLGLNVVQANPALGYGLVNQAIYALLNSQKSLQGGGGAGEKLRKMLQKLLSQQSTLTKNVSGLLPLPLPSKNNLSSLLSQYGNLQEQLRKMASQLAKLSNDEGVKSEVSKAIKEMREAEKDLKNGRISQKTLKHQRKALQHLLRAYRSVRKRGVERKRASTPGKSFVPEIVPLPHEMVVHQKVDSLLKYLATEGSIRDTFIKLYIENLRKQEK